MILPLTENGLISVPKVAAFVKTQGHRNPSLKNVAGKRVTFENVMTAIRLAIFHGEHKQGIFQIGLAYIMEDYAGLHNKTVLAGKTTKGLKKCPICGQRLHKIEGDNLVQLVCLTNDVTGKQVLGCGVKTEPTEPEFFEDTVKYQFGKLKDWMEFEV